MTQDDHDHHDHCVHHDHFDHSEFFYLKKIYFFSI